MRNRSTIASSDRGGDALPFLFIRLDPPELQCDQRGQMKQIGIREDGPCERGEGLGIRCVFQCEKDFTHPLTHALRQTMSGGGAEDLCHRIPRYLRRPAR